MIRIATAAVLGLALLGACASEIEGPSDAKRPLVRPLVSLHAVEFAPGSAELTAGEAQRLTRFVAAVAPQPGDPLLIELPAGSLPAGLAAQRAAAVGAGLAAVGLPSRTVALAEDGGDRVRVAVETVAVSAPEDCPDWQQTGLLERFGNGVAANFGCATAQNFSVMLARPRDALEGQPTGAAPAERLTVPVRLYGAGAPIPLPGGQPTGGTEAQ